MGAENFSRNSSEDFSGERKKNSDLMEEVTHVTEEVTHDLDTVTTSVEQDPTVAGIEQAQKDFVDAIKNNELESAREIMFCLRAYASADPTKRHDIASALGNMIVGGVSLSDTIASIYSESSLDEISPSLECAIKLYLDLRGYYLTDSTYTTGDLYSAVKAYGEFITTWRHYIKKYTPVDNKNKATFAYPSLEALATTYEQLAATESPGVRDGWLRAAAKAPVVKNLLEQKKHISDINAILDTDPSNDLQELMFVYLYNAVRQRSTELADEAIAQHHETEFQNAQAKAKEAHAMTVYAKEMFDKSLVSDEFQGPRMLPHSGVLQGTAPEGTTYAKTTLDQVIVSAEFQGPRKLPSLHNGVLQGKELIANPRKGYSDAILVHVNALIDEKNRAAEPLDLEGKLRQCGVAIGRLVVAADAADPEKKGEVDEHLSYTLEKDLLSLYRLTVNNSDLRKELQELVILYITSYLFSHTCQIDRFVAFVELLDGEQQAFVMLQYAQLEPNLDPGVVEHIRYLLEFDLPPTNSDEKYASPLALGLINDGIKQIGETELEKFNHLSSLSLNELGKLYTQLLQVIGGTKIDGTTWNMPLIEQAPGVFGEGYFTLLPEQRDLFRSGNASTDLSTIDRSNALVGMQENFIDPRAALVLFVQDIYLEKLQTELANNDEVARDNALALAVELLNTRTSHIDSLLQASFLEGLAGVLFLKHTTIDKDVALDTLGKLTPKEIVDATFAGQDTYENKKNTDVASIVADLDDALFTSLVGIDKTTFLNNAGNITLGQLNIADQMLIYSMSECGSDAGKVQSLLSELTLQTNMFFVSTLEANGDKMFSLNKAGFTDAENKLYNSLTKRGETSLDGLYTTPPRVQEMRFRIPAGLLRRLKPIQRRVSTKAFPVIKRFVIRHGTYDKIINTFVGRTRKQIGVRMGVGALFYSTGSMMEQAPEKDRFWDRETLFKTAGFVVSAPGAGLAMGVKAMLGLGYDARREQKPSTDIDDLQPNEQTAQEYVHWEVAEYTEIDVEKGAEKIQELNIPGKKIPILGSLIETIESAAEKGRTDQLIIKGKIRVKPFFDKQKMEKTISYEGFQPPPINQQSVTITLPNPAFEITFVDVRTQLSNDGMLNSDGSAQKTLEGVVQEKILIEALIFCLTGQIKDNKENPRTLQGMRELYKQHVVAEYIRMGFKAENIRVMFDREGEYENQSQNMNIDWENTARLMENTQYKDAFDKLRRQYESQDGKEKLRD